MKELELKYWFDKLFEEKQINLNNVVLIHFEKKSGVKSQYFGSIKTIYSILENGDFDKKKIIQENIIKLGNVKCVDILREILKVLDEA